MKCGLPLLVIVVGAGCASEITYRPSLNNPEEKVRELTPEDIEKVGFDWTIERVVEEFGMGDIPDIMALIYPAKGEKDGVYHFFFETKRPEHPVWAVIHGNYGREDPGRIVWPPKWAGKDFERLPPFEERQ